ncbi:MAG: TIGR02147 family protein [Pseudobdellovibrionaceae bacterium]
MRVNTILKNSLKRRKKEQKEFSLRYIAKLLNVKHSFLSDLLNNKKKWPLPLLDKMVEVLKLDELAKKDLADSLLQEHIKELKRQSKLLRSVSSTNKDLENLSITAPTNSFHEEPVGSTQLLSHWYFISLLDLVTCDEFKHDYSWIAKKLRISSYEAEFAWQYLLREGYIHFKEGRWQKTSMQLRLPTLDAQAHVQRYHKDMIQKGLKIMSEQSTPEAFENRLIIGLSIATNLKNLKEAKEALHVSAYSAAEKLRAGPTTNVYQLCVLLYPVTDVKI